MRKGRKDCRYSSAMDQIINVGESAAGTKDVHEKGPERQQGLVCRKSCNETIGSLLAAAGRPDEEGAEWRHAPSALTAESEFEKSLAFINFQLALLGHPDMHKARHNLLEGPAAGENLTENNPIYIHLQLGCA